MLRGFLPPAPGSAILDVGCGTGYFTRRLCAHDYRVTGIDPAPAMIRYAAAHSLNDGTRYVVGDARSLPFADGQFEFTVAMTSLCFIVEQQLALQEMARVSRGGVALGLLNRHSLLYLQKGRRGGRGAYRGARWHSPEEVRHLFSASGLRLMALRSAIQLPRGGDASRWLERRIGDRVLTGAFLLAVGEPDRE